MNFPDIHAVLKNAYANSYPMVATYSNYDYYSYEYISGSVSILGVYTIHDTYGGE